MEPTIQWTPEGVVMIDQTRLPREVVFVTCRDYIEVADAIKTMIIRGAPAIGVAAAMGMALGALHADPARLDDEIETIGDTLAATRPTAVNLFWAIDRMKRLYASLRGQPVEQIREALVRKPNRFTSKTSPSTRPSDATARPSSPTTKPYSPTATPAPSPPPAMAPLSASFAPPSAPASPSMSSPTKPARSSRAPASLSGN